MDLMKELEKLINEVFNEKVEIPKALLQSTIEFNKSIIETLKAQNEVFKELMEVE